MFFFNDSGLAQMELMMLNPQLIVNFSINICLLLNISLASPHQIVSK